MMIGVDRPLEPVVRDVQPLAHRDEMRGHLVGKVARFAPEVACFLVDLEPVFVGPGLEAHVAPRHALETGDDVGGDGFVGMADMRLAVGVADRGGDVIGFGHPAGLTF